MRTLKVLAGIGILSILTLIGIFVSGYSEPIIVDKEYIGNHDIKITLQYDDNNVQAPHVETFYNVFNNTIIVYDTKIEKFTGSSMQPTIFTGNLLLIQKYSGNKKSLQEGMIIGHIGPNKNTIVHRIKGKYEHYLEMRGDNQQKGYNITYYDVKYIVKGVLFT